MAGWFLTNNTSWEAQSRVESQQQKRQKLLGCSLGGRHQMGMSRQGPPPVFSRPPPAQSVYTQGSHLWHCWCLDWVLCCGAVLCPGGVSSSPGLDSLGAGSTPSSHDRPPPRQGGVGLDGLWLRTAVLEQPAHGACLKEEEKINLVLSQGAWKITDSVIFIRIHGVRTENVREGAGEGIKGLRGDFTASLHSKGRTSAGSADAVLRLLRVGCFSCYF